MSGREFIPLSELPDPNITTDMPRIEVRDDEPVRLPYQRNEIFTEADTQALTQMEQFIQTGRVAGKTAVDAYRDEDMMAGNEEELRQRLKEQKEALAREKAEQDRLERERKAKETQEANDRLRDARDKNNRNR